MLKGRYKMFLCSSLFKWYSPIGQDFRRGLVVISLVVLVPFWRTICSTFAATLQSSALKGPRALGFFRACLASFFSARAFQPEVSQGHQPAACSCCRMD